jgi:hypothetical protein
MITPSDSASAPAQYDAVPVQGTDIQAPQQDLSGTFAAATALAAPGSERQTMTESLLSSPPGFATEGYDIDSGFAAGWDTNVAPGG